MSAEAIQGALLVVEACDDTDALLADPVMDDTGLRIMRVEDAAQAISRIEAGEAVDVVLLAPRLADPVRVAQRLHSLDRDAAVVILTTPKREPEVRYALEVAPFLEGDVVATSTAEPAALGPALARAARRARERREEALDRQRPRDTPPHLSARYLGTLLDSAPIGIVTLDADGDVIGWNRRAGEMLEVPEVDALGTSFAALWPDTARPRIEALIESLDTTGLSSGGETLDRAGRTFEVTGARFGTRSGESGSILVLQDVTARVAAQRELGLQKALLEAQSESSIAAIAVVSLDGQLQTINRRWLEIWAVDEDTIRRDPARATELMLAQVADPEAFMAGIEALVGAAQGEFRDEVRLRDGRTVERYGAYVRNDAGESIGRVWFHTDITARKQDEDALRFLAEATETLSSSLDYETTLRRVAELAVPRFADWCGVEVVAEGGLRNIAVAHEDPEKVRLARDLQTRYPAPRDGSRGVSRVVATGEAELYPEVTDEMITMSAIDDGHLALLRALELRSVIIVPIRTAERILGGISFVSSRRIYNEDDVTFAKELARRAAIAIDNAMVHQALRETARTLQESLLPPHLPPIDGVGLAARFRPAATGIDVGGDFYDIFETGERQWGFVIGDVCGKGAEAATLTALTRYTVRTAAMYEESAAGVLRVLNEALLRQHTDYRFTTLAYAVLDMSAEQSTLRVATGGHPSVLVLRADGSAEAVETHGPLLGVVPGAEFSETVLPVHPGDAFVLLTDGLTDAHAPDRVLEEGDLLAELERARGLAAPEIGERLERLALGDSKEPVRDDIAVVVARLEG